MAFTQTQLDALETAIAAGTLEVTTGDKKVRYHSLDEMIRLRDIIKTSWPLILKPKKPRQLCNLHEGLIMWLDDLIGVFRPFQA